MDDQFEEAKKWLNEFQQDSSKEVIKNLGLLLGEELSISMQEWSVIERDRTLPIFSLPLCTSSVQISKSYNGSGILIFQKRTAILLSGILSMYNKTVLDEKLETLEMDESDIDAFGEICNQLIGSLDRITTDLLPDKVHLQQKDTFLWERKKEMQFPFDDTHLIVFPYSAEIKDIKGYFLRKVEWLNPNQIQAGLKQMNFGTVDRGEITLFLNECFENEEKYVDKRKPSKKDPDSELKAQNEYKLLDSGRELLQIMNSPTIDFINKRMKESS